MFKKKYLPFFKAALFITLLGSSFYVKGQTKSNKPNIIIILADDLGWGDVGFHGSEIKTPNLDAFSKEGVILSHFYTAPICSPTRAGLLTGVYPNRFGLRETVVPPWSEFGVDLNQKLMPQYLAEIGYKNRVMLGKWHLGHSKKSFLPLERGFTHFYGHYNGAIDYFTHKREGEIDWHNDWETSYDNGYSTDLITNEAVSCIKKFSKEAPFLMYVAYNAPHSPLQAKEEDLIEYGYDDSKPKFSNESDGYGGQGKGNTKRQTYSAMVTNMDRGIGKILDALKEAGVEENTLVLFFSDNGAAPNEGSSSGNLRGKKFTEWDGGVRSPAIVRWPKAFKGGRTVNYVMGYIDVLPTLLNAAEANDLPDNANLDGINMLPVLKGKEVISDRNFYLGYGSIINTNWKLVRANAGNSRMHNTEDLLFNIRKDPYEKNDIKATHPKIYEELLIAVNAFDSIKPKKAVSPYGQGRKGYKAPKNWMIKK